MRVLVTGAAGFIGTHVASALAVAGHDVVGLDALVPQAHGTDAIAPAGVHIADVRDGALLDSLLGDVDAVCHQAAMVGNGVDAQDLPAYAAHNDLGTAELLAAMARRGIDRLVLASSMVAYGDGRYTCEYDGSVGPAPRAVDDLAAGSFDPRCEVCGGPVRWRPIDESAPIRPRTSYAASKVAQEHYSGAWCTLQSARCIALRYHNVYGPGMPADTPYSGVAAIFRSALERGEAPRVFEDGRQTRDFVHVQDVARANVAALEALESHGVGVTAYNVCSGTPFTIGEMASVLADAARGPEPVVTGEYRAFDVRHVVASPDRARTGLGFEARVRPDVGLVELASARLRTR
ncbi:NAD-dependent epimerase/dehydratase family protein [Solicola gregarius]|uniref:NAD-dependent epimerase/dehydratase family protein n=1 Tax=Solicola gregarius TaxID=2908642 RepID=A0AA46TGS1_9ACTN|nr:NAD-dependent epimerase/dehydratase family protein [Solicola gregarius]UYM04549.1 NAD-dependent epimerase/dehydratase family protein [Solicola gregarius]